MKKLSFLLFFLLPFFAFSQGVPQAINYQAVARDGDGVELANQEIKVQISIIEDDVIRYVEVFDPVSTNEFGLFNLAIGKGTPNIGSFQDVDWTRNSHKLLVSIDIGDGFQDVGSEVLLLSVPYALVADTVHKGPSLSYNNAQDSLLITGGKGVPVQSAPDGDWQTSNNRVYNLTDKVLIGASQSLFGPLHNKLYVEGGAGVDTGFTATHLRVTADDQTNFGFGVTGALAELTETQQNTAPISGFTAQVTQSSSSNVQNATGFAATVGGSGSADKYGASFRANGINSSILNIGVRGEATGGASQNAGVIGVVETDPSFTNIGVAGFSTVNNGAFNYGVYGEADNADSVSWAGFFDGDIGHTGLVINVSDRKFKQNILPVKRTLPLVMKLKPVNYTFVEEFDGQALNFTQGPQIGFIAQDLETVFPSLVFDKAFVKPKQSGRERHNPIDYKGVNYIGMVPVLTKAIQEQQELIESLEKRIEELEKKVK